MASSSSSSSLALASSAFAQFSSLALPLSSCASRNCHCNHLLIDIFCHFITSVFSGIFSIFHLHRPHLRHDLLPLHTGPLVGGRHGSNDLPCHAMIAMKFHPLPCHSTIAIKFQALPCHHRLIHLFAGCSLLQALMCGFSMCGIQVCYAYLHKSFP